jgi:hypothetical protein
VRRPRVGVLAEAGRAVALSVGSALGVSQPECVLRSNAATEQPQLPSPRPLTSSALLGCLSPSSSYGCCTAQVM